jgi:hypothetical protein
MRRDMDARGRPVYKEWTPWPGWIQIVFWGTMLAAMATVGISGDDPPQERLVGAAVLAIVAVAVQWLVAGLSVKLYRDDMVVGLGFAGWISKRMRYADIVDLTSVRYHPLREFGGWGVRFGSGGKRAWTARGNQAVVLHLQGGTQVYVGSDEPHRLEARIRAVAGNRIGPEQDVSA